LETFDQRRQRCTFLTRDDPVFKEHRAGKQALLSIPVGAARCVHGARNYFPPSGPGRSESKKKDLAAGGFTFLRAARSGDKFDD
jgi:hypothetical protein